MFFLNRRRPLVFSVGASLIPYGLPCLRELFRFLISLTNPHDRHNTDAMMHMGLQLLTVALESGHIANYQSLLGLVKDELSRHLFQVKEMKLMLLAGLNHALQLRVSREIKRVDSYGMQTSSDF